MQSRRLIVLLLVVGLAAFLALAEDKDKDKEKDQDKDKDKDKLECHKQPKNCCSIFEWSMLTDPAGFEKKTRCKITCCERAFRKQSGNSGVARQRQSILTDLSSCVMELIIAISNVNFKLPPSCCKIPPISLLPVCSSPASRGLPSSPINCHPKVGGCSTMKPWRVADSPGSDRINCNPKIANCTFKPKRTTPAAVALKNDADDE